MVQSNLGSVLHVDDDPDILWLTEQSLNDAGFHVVTSESPLRAIELSRETVFDIAIVDYSMTEMNGDVLAHRLWEINKNLEIIFVTGRSEFINKLSLEIPQALVLLKPVLDDILIEAVSLRIVRDPEKTGLVPPETYTQVPYTQVANAIYY